MLSGRPGRCGSLVVFLALLAGFVAPAKGSVSCDTYDEDDCAADSKCFWIEDWDRCYDTCEDLNEDSCHDHCAWIGDSCSLSCRAEYGDDEDDCAADSDCVWIEDWDSCQDTCDDRDEDHCDWPCEWIGDSCSLS